MATPPIHLLSDYNPRDSKVAQLRNILLQHNVPYNSAAKKQELVDSYETHIRPQAAALLAEMQRVRPSNAGILDGESQDGSSLHELDTGPESSGEDDAPKRKAPARKARKSSAAPEPSSARKPAAKAKVRKAPAPRAKPKEDDDVFSDDAGPIQRPKVRRPFVGAAPPPKPKRVEEEVEAAPRMSPQKRRQQSSGPEERKRAKPDSPTSAEKDRRQSLKYESGGESGFSDFNPFQSGNEGTPDAKPRRRKSSVGPIRHQNAEAGPSVFKGRKSMPATVSSWPTAGSASGVRTPFSHSHSPPPVPNNQFPSSGMRSPFRPSAPPPVPPLPQGLPSLGTPIGFKYMAPVESLKRSPPEVLKLQQEYAKMEEERARAAIFADDQFDEPAQEPEPEPAQALRPKKSAGSLRWSDQEQQQEQQPEVRPRKSSSGLRWIAHQDDLKSVEDDRHEIRKTPAPKKLAMVAGTGRGGPQPSTVPRISSSLVPKKVVISPASPSRTPKVPFAFTRLHLLPLVPVLLLLAGWREEKVVVGFCDTSSSSNRLLTTRTYPLSLPISLPISLSALLPPPSPFLQSVLTSVLPTCTPCPPHGVCKATNFVGCESEYVPAENPFSLGQLLPLAPTCRPDTEKLIAVAELASRLARKLRKRRGEVVCQGWERKREVDGKGVGGEAWVFGVQSEVVEEELRSENENSRSPYSDTFFDDILRLAIADLVSHQEAVADQVDGEVWLAAKTADMPLSCRLRRAAIRNASEHKCEIGTVLSLVALVLYLRSTIQSRKQESQRVRELVQNSLAQLRDQERRHYTDPVLAPTPYIAPSHLRDLVLQHEHSPARRHQLWNKVERVVEGNSNVRARQVEHLGEEIRAWEWTGVSGGEAPGTPSLYPKLG